MCSAVSGSKVVFTSLPSEPGKLGWILPCEAFKGLPKLMGQHCLNVDETSVDEAMLNSGYFQVVKAFATIWESLPPCMRGTCLAVWIRENMVDKDGELIRKEDSDD